MHKLPKIMNFSRTQNPFHVKLLSSKIIPENFLLAPKSVFKKLLFNYARIGSRFRFLRLTTAGLKMCPEIVQLMTRIFWSITNWLAGIDVVMFDQENLDSILVLCAVLQCTANLFPHVRSDWWLGNVFRSSRFVTTSVDCPFAVEVRNFYDFGLINEMQFVWSSDRSNSRVLQCLFGRQLSDVGLEIDFSCVMMKNWRQTELLRKENKGKSVFYALKVKI